MSFTYWCLLSAMFCSFQCTSLSSPWLIYAWEFYSFQCYCKWNYLHFLFKLFTVKEYRNTTNFCMLIMCPATLLNSLINSRIFCVDSLGLSTYKSCFLWTVIILFLPFHLNIFTSFSCLIVLSRTSTTMLNRSNKSRYLFDFRRKTFSLHHWIWC